MKSKIKNLKLIRYVFLLLIIVMSIKTYANDIQGKENENLSINRDDKPIQYVTIDFRNVSLDILTRFISEKLKINILLEKNADVNVNIIAPTKIPVNDLMKLYKSVININGLDLIKDGNIYKVVKKDNKLRLWIANIYLVFSIHLLIWIVLFLFYTKSNFVRSFFFWSPYIRKYLGLGYIHLLIIWLPMLRKIILKPFRETFIMDASIKDFNEYLYYKNIFIKEGFSDKKLSIFSAFEKLRGQVLIVGESGLGKTLFLRYYSMKSNNNIVFLPAEKCSKGVISGIQEKLHGILKDRNFLENLIYSGGIDIIIDGLNEVNPDTRAEIRNFVGIFTKCNIVISSQPIEWKPPKNVDIYELLPLNDDQIEEFLITGKGINIMNSINDNRNSKIYQETCKQYINEILKGNLRNDEVNTYRYILSNPMDLTVVAQLLSLGIEPNLFRLNEQQYKEMEKYYKICHAGRAFPIDKFSHCIFNMKLNDQYILPYDDYIDEIDCMEHFKMVIRHEKFNSQGQKVAMMSFRHEKIMDFFIVFHFLHSKDLPSKYLNDGRFRGVYFMLANLMPVNEANALREELIIYSAKSKDHNISDDFIRLLNLRKQNRSE